MSAAEGDEITDYGGVVSQTVSCAIRACAGRMMPERLGQAIRMAGSKGYITGAEVDQFDREGLVQ